MSNRWQKYMYQGKERGLAEIARMCGLKPNTLYHRINVQGMALEEAVNAPLNKAELHPFMGEMLEMKEIAKRVHMDANAIRARMKKYGISAEDAVDGNYAQGKYAYQGERIYAEEIARRAGVDAGALKRMLNNRVISADEAVRIIKNSAEESCKARRRPEALKSKRAIAERLIGQIVNAPEITERSDGSFQTCTRHYEITVVFRGRELATLTVRWRKTGTVSMVRKYAVSGDTMTQVEGTSA